MNVLSLTRVEEDAFTITKKDTTFTDAVKNAPGERDNGVIYPSSRTLTINSVTNQYDSIIERTYPDFIRVALFESVGLIGTSASDKGLGSGLFGVMGYFDPDFDRIFNPNTHNVLFTGAIYRFGVFESRLRWFHDAKDWTIGTSAYEMIIPEAGGDATLSSVFPFYFRKRYYLREEIPYIAVTPSVGIGYLPSQYINASVSLDVGSMGGVNFRMYAGAAGGNTRISRGVSSAFPYLGIGISLFDFLNRVPELYKEWKYHEHSAWDIGIVQFSLLTSGESSALSLNNPSAIIRGYAIRLLPVELALPLLNHKLYAGTSLFNILVLGKDKYGVGILPLRVGYWQTILENELTVEPFIEYNYYPSSFVNLAAKLNLKTSLDVNLHATLGYVNGNTVSGSIIPPDILGRIGNATSLSGVYFSVGVGINDRIFFPSQLRYNTTP
jgi:hypothetical protein